MPHQSKEKKIDKLFSLNNNVPSPQHSVILPAPDPSPVVGVGVEYQQKPSALKSIRPNGKYPPIFAFIST